MAEGRRDASSERPKTSVLFVCHANMCRSPLAHGIFVHMIQQAGISDRVHVDSAGTWALDGIDPHPLSVQVAAEHGIDLSVCGVSRSIAPEDLQRFTHIIAMDRANESDILRLRRLSAFGAVEGGQARVRLLRAITSPRVQGLDADVPDPVRQGPDAYAYAYEIIEAGCRALLEELRGS